MMDVRDMAIERNPRLFTVEEYHRMGEAGVFAPDERVELLDGEILIVPPMGPLHASSVERVNRAFVLRLAEHASVRPGLPVELSNFSEPEPDFTLARRRLDAYESAAVRPQDVFALVEIADSSLGFDRRRKLQAYARAGVPEYWIVNLRERTVERYREPNDLGYASVSVAKRGARVAFATFPGVEFAVEELTG
jgi:Uma2 family endonuclease